MPKPLRMVSGCSKAAVIGITNAATAALAANRIRVNAIRPGVVNTKMTDELNVDRARVRSISTEDSLKGMVANIPLGLS